METDRRMIPTRKDPLVALLLAILALSLGCSSSREHRPNVTNIPASAARAVVSAIHDLQNARDTDTQEQAAEQFREKYRRLTATDSNIHGWSLFLLDSNGNLLDQKKVSEQKKAVWVRIVDLYNTPTVFSEFQIRLLSEKSLFILLLPD
jgi:hypothetical protein